MQYGQMELFQLLNTTNHKRLLGYVIKVDGIWIDPLSEIDKQYLTPDEIADMYKPFRAHDTKLPVLKLPCSGRDLACFLNETGFDAMIIEPVNLLGDTISQPTLIKTIVDRAASNLYKSSGKFPPYMAVIREIKRIGNNSEIEGAVILAVDGESGVKLPDGTTIAIKTIRNWLTAYKKTLPEFCK